MELSSVHKKKWTQSIPFIFIFDVYILRNRVEKKVWTVGVFNSLRTMSPFIIIRKKVWTVGVYVGYEKSNANWIIS